MCAQLNAQPRKCQHVYERIEIEQVQLAAHEVRHAWLRHAQAVCSLRLGRAPLLSHFRQSDGQSRACQFDIALPQKSIGLKIGGRSIGLLRKYLYIEDNASIVEKWRQ